MIISVRHYAASRRRLHHQCITHLQSITGVNTGERACAATREASNGKQ